ncbi:MAG: HlyD family type I secretion periplasmic adaptor subunit [Alphaproteobacteria bacterium]|nr:HlyD family type I secretion periplasmic adaptor subunit [Alphaproteobacteria bacterium]MBU0805039.1 HlyD family type I secretion periplasmic adaptor subunit [Alphaproteobacteria bacterium]MBU0870538.1 HlyD family type I secretion periplasmic adaptor subunit [Alphaproteobacteria bacterium]MBU1401787.1 HlyD family type I secretion periplasmic adaptor subunit [Alphaproteobacteria bacterium]MBU1591796.1 HlyD family type I secretion periplasmic adaptor subunit [Alphaproteobacteria bacterium]
MNALTTIDHTQWYVDVPRSIRGQTIVGLLLLVLTFGGFGVWAFTAPLAAAVVAQGSFVATGQNKIIQHLEGGIIDKIFVEEGDHVEEGDPIVRLDETAARANERQLILRRARLEAINARLLAEYNGDEKVNFPRFLLDQRSDPEVAAILESQSLSFQASRRKLESDLSLLHSNMESLEHRAKGYMLERQAMVRQVVLLKEELAGKLILLDQGFMRKPETNAVRRAIADAEGQIGKLAAEASETESQIEKHRGQLKQVEASYRQAAVDELQAIEAELDSVREQTRSAENILRRVVIEAPVSGTVVRLHYHTSGGVIESGKSIVEIIPTDVPLIIETQIARTEIDSVRVGQPVAVRLTALNRRTTPVLDGSVYYVSADSIPDSNPSQPREFYVARIRLPSSELRRVPGFSPTPGMPAEIMIKTQERTFFSYLSRPILDSMQRAFREQ